MVGSDFETLHGELRLCLAETISLLRQHGNVGWCKWLERADDQLARGDAHGLVVLDQMFGGMGSFNDFCLSQPGQPDHAQADDRLDHLRSEICRLSYALRPFVGD